MPGYNLRSLGLLCPVSTYRSIGTRPNFNCLSRAPSCSPPGLTAPSFFLFSTLNKTIEPYRPGAQGSPVPLYTAGGHCLWKPPCSVWAILGTHTKIPKYPTPTPTSSPVVPTLRQPHHERTSTSLFFWAPFPPTATVPQYCNGHKSRTVQVALKS